MYAVIQDGPHQFKVKSGDRIWVAHRVADPGATLVFDKVLVCGEDTGAVRIGMPHVGGARVMGEVLGPVKGQKVISHMYRRRKKSHVRKGHRQKAVAVKITKIEVS